ncbi:MAG TPA: hypothetical protein VGM62_19040 [Chthoniobacterales bacterium]|jgi:hypothetical protein
MKPGAAVTVKAFLIELLIYSVLVIAYFFLVLHLLGGWLNELSAQHRLLYALVAVVLIIGQAVFLEATTTLLLRLIRGRSE